MMNELDENLAQLFAEDDEAHAQSDAFLAAVRRRVARRRVVAKTLATCGIGAAASAAVAIVTFMPEVAAYPGAEIGRLLGSPTGAAACMLASIGAAWWNRYGDEA
jgi:hypothetical protein